MIFGTSVLLEAKTDDMSREEWLEARRSGIGGSDAGAVCGLNPYKSQIDVWFDKLGKADERKDNEAMRQGRDLEKYVAERFSEATGKKVYELPAMLRNSYYPYALADVDRLIDGEQAGLECKTASPYAEKKWADGKIPPEYELQCHHYMMITGAECWYIACLIYGRDFVWRKIERDEETIQNLARIEEEFWREHVSANVMPSADGSDAYNNYLSEKYADSDSDEIEDISAYAELLERREDIDNLQKKLDKEKKQIEQTIKSALQEAETGCSEQWQVKWKTVTSNKIDTKMLKENFSDVYKKCLKTSSYRRFSVGRIGE